MKKIYPYIILTILGALVVIIAFFVKPDTITNNEFIYTVFLNIGFAVLTIVIVNFLWFILGGQPLEEIIHKSVNTFKLASDGFKVGLDRIFLVSSEFATPNEWIVKLKSAKNEIDLMGYSLCMLTRTNDFQNTLLQLVNKNIKIRILIMDEENEHFGAALNFEALSSLTLESMKGEVEACTHCVEYVRGHIKKNKEKNFKFEKVKKGLTECQIIRIDNYLYVTPYLYSKHTSGSPLFTLKKQEGGLYDKYVEEFETLWKLNSGK